MAAEETTDASHNASFGRSSYATSDEACHSQVYTRGGTALVIENPFCSRSGLPSYALHTVASRIRTSMSIDKLSTDEMPFCHKYRPPSTQYHSIKVQRSRSIENGLRSCHAEFQKTSEQLSTPRRKGCSSSRAKSNCSTPVSMQTPPQLNSPLRSTCKPSALSSSFTEDRIKSTRNKDMSLKLGNFATLPGKLKKEAGQDEVMAASLHSAVTEEASEHRAQSTATDLEKQEANKLEHGLVSPSGTDGKSRKQGNASTPIASNKEFSKQVGKMSSKETNRSVTAPPSAPNRDLNKQIVGPKGSAAKESTKQGSTASTPNVLGKDLNIKQKKRLGTSKSPVPVAAKEAELLSGGENEGMQPKDDVSAETETFEAEVTSNNSAAICLETSVEKNALEVGKEDPVKSKADPAVDEYRARLAEKRRLAREKAEREVEEEQRRQEALRLAEEERLRAEEEEQRRREEEELRLAEELKKAEEERFQRMVELEERRRREEAEQLEAEMQAKIEQQRRAKEEAEKQEQERQARIKKEEEEKLDRKRRLDSIMKRVKTDETPAAKDEAPTLKKLENEPKTNGILATDDISEQKSESPEKPEECVPPRCGGPPTLLTMLNTSVDGVSVEEDKASDSLTPKFKSPLLQQILAGKNRTIGQVGLQKVNATVQLSDVEEVKIHDDTTKCISDDVPSGSGQMNTACV